MGPVVEHAHQEEERAGADAVVEHLEDGALGSDHGEGGQAQHHEAHVADGGVGHQLLDVALHHGHQRTVDDGDDAQQRQGLGIVHGRIGKHGDGEADEAIAAELQQHAGQDHRTRRGRLDVGVRQPGVQGEQRHLDGEGHGEGEEEPALDTEGQRRGRRSHHCRVEAAGLARQVEEGHQPEQRTSEGVEEELGGSVAALIAAPDPDHEVHRDEHGFPEQVEEEQVLGHEGPQHAGLQQEEQGSEGTDAVLQAVPGAEHGEGHQKGREQHQPEVQAVHAEGVVHRQTHQGEPGGTLSQDRSQGAAAAQQPGEAQDEHGNGAHEAHHAGEAGLGLGERQDGEAQQGRCEDQEGEGMGVQPGHRPTYFRKT